MEIQKVDGPEPQAGLINRLSDVLSHDERVFACWLHGSFGAGRPDRYSDIDMAVAVEDERFHHAFESVREAAHAAGDVLVSWDSPKDINGAGFTCFYADRNFLDVKVYRLSRMSHISPGTPMRMLFARDEGIRHPEDPAVSEEHLGPPVSSQVHWKMVFFCLCAYSAIRFIKRAEYWYAAGMINAVRGTLAQLYWLWKNPDERTDMSYIVWGVVRRDLDPHLSAELEATVTEAQKAELSTTLGKLLEAFRSHGRQIAADTGSEYPARLFETIQDFYDSELSGPRTGN